MATETLKNQSDSEESPNKTLAPSDPVISKSSSAAANSLEESSYASTQPSPQPSATDEEGGESKCGNVSSGGVAVGGSSVENNGPDSNVQKKMRRAERFGMPVQLSEEEKRNSRAERFGTRSGSLKTDALKNSEEQKKKARAERFGIPGQSLVDEEAKKKARLAKFEPASKNDPIEEDKRKARAARFSQANTSSLSHVNGEGNIGPKAAIAGKASGGT